jgi:COP9 signalosome complex subunit 4
MAPPDVQKPLDKLQELLNDTNPSSKTAKLKEFLSSVIAENPTVARPLLDAFIAAFSTKLEPLVQHEVGTEAIRLLATKIVSFEDQDLKLREALATLYEGQNDNAEAAAILGGIHVESSQRMVTDEEKVRIWVRITRNLLEEDETIKAETYLNRAKNLLFKVADPELKLHFQTCEAKILDSQRKFLQASEKYHSLSFSNLIAEDDRIICLSAAIVCGVLAPAGPLRSRALANLYKDERSKELQADYIILEKMYLDRLLSPSETKDFAKRLAPHQLAQTEDGLTVLAKAVIEHNLLGASKLYDNIGVADLGLLLGLDGSKAEEYAARMMEQGRLVGRIDQIDEFIYFDGDDKHNSHGKAVNPAYSRELRKWDENVQRLAEQVERVAAMVPSQG